MKVSYNEVEKIDLKFEITVEEIINNNFREDNNLPTGYVDYDNTIIDINNPELFIFDIKIELTDEQKDKILEILKAKLS